MYFNNNNLIDVKIKVLITFLIFYVLLVFLLNFIIKINILGFIDILTNRRKKINAVMDLSHII